MPPKRNKKGPPKKPFRRFAFTDFDRKKTIEEIYLDDRVNTIAWGNEVCPETKREHRQGLIELVDPMRYTAVQEILGSKCHVEIEANKDAHTAYIAKEGKVEVKGPKKVKQQGARTDLDKFYKEIKEGKSEKEVLEGNVGAYIKYPRAYERIKKVYDRKPLWRKMEVMIIWGKAGMNKSHYPACVHGEENVYRLTSKMAKTEFWRDYNNEDIIVLDEFTGSWMKYEDLNQILDGYPYNINLKGSSTWAKYTKVYITSNDKPQKWYPGVFAKNYEKWQALKRRVLWCTEWTSPHWCEHIKGRFNLSQKWMVILS